MRALVEIRRTVLQQGDIKEQLRQIQHRIIEHETQLSAIYDAIENLLDDKAAQRSGMTEKGLDLKINRGIRISPNSEASRENSY